MFELCVVCLNLCQRIHESGSMLLEKRDCSVRRLQGTREKRGNLSAGHFVTFSVAFSSALIAAS